MPVGQLVVQMLLADWLLERLVVGLWEGDCHSGPGTVVQYQAGIALMKDLKMERRKRAGYQQRRKKTRSDKRKGEE